MIAPRVVMIHAAPRYAGSRRRGILLTSRYVEQRRRQQRPNSRCCRLDTGCYAPDSLSHYRSLPQFNPPYRDAPERPRGGASVF